ncbi:vWA domain-containing protein [Streptomyces sp. SD15]
MKVTHWLRSGAALLLLLPGTLGFAPAHSPSSPSTPDASRPALARTDDAAPLPQTDRATALGELGLDSGADYVVVIDSSGSMRAHREQVTRALQSLLDGLGPRDRAALVSFRAAPDPAGIVAPLEAVDAPDALVRLLPDEYGSTDISTGVDQGLRVLERSTEVRPAALVLITDAGQTPDTASPAGWQRLVDRIAQLRARQQPSSLNQLVRGVVLDWGGGDRAEAFRVGPGCRATSSYTIAQCLFGRSETSQVAPARAAQSLRALPDEFADRGLEALLAPDAARVRTGDAVRVRLGRPRLTGTDSADVPVTFSSRTGHLPLRVQDITAHVDGLSPNVAGTLEKPVDLAPGADATTTLRVRWNETPRPWYAAGPPSRTGTVTLRYTLASRYSAVMSRASVPDHRFAPGTGTGSVGLSVPASTLWWSEVAALALLVLLLLIRLGGFPARLWVVTEPDGTRPAQVLVWLPRQTVRRRVSTDRELTLTVRWKPHRAWSREGPLRVVLWPLGRSTAGTQVKPQHALPLRRYGSRAALPGFEGLRLVRGGWLRPRRKRP